MNARKIVVTALLALFVVALAATGAQAAKGGGGKPPKDPTAAPTPEPTEVPAGGGSLGEMHVDFMVVTYGSTQDTYGVCRAAIVDSDGNRIDGVQVTFDTTDPFVGTNTVTQTLGENGDQARLEQRRRERYSCGKRGIPQTFSCTVTDVYHVDYNYAPELNLETTDSDTCLDDPVG